MYPVVFSLKQLKSQSRDPNDMSVVLLADPSKLAIDADDTDDEDAPKISLAEMLDDLHIAEDATGGEEADMME